MIAILLRDMRGKKTSLIAAYQKKLLIDCIKEQSHLDLSYQNLTPEDLSNLFSAITAIEQPIHLNLTGNGIDIVGAKVIATFLKRKSLSIDLDLRFNKLGDKGALVLQSILSNKRGMTLDLRYNKMSKEGIATLVNQTARMNVSRNDGGWIVEDPDSEEIQMLFEEASKGFKRTSKIMRQLSHKNPALHFLYNTPVTSQPLSADLASTSAPQNAYLPRLDRGIQEGGISKKSRL